MKLTRRDALLGAAAGLGGGALSSAFDTAGSATGQEVTEVELDTTEIETLVDLTEVIYPAKVTATKGFVRGYVGRLETDHRRRIREAIGDLNTYARSVCGRRFGDLSTTKREAILREISGGAVHPRPDGTVSARVRYHLVNGLLYALFTSPKGSSLFDIANPLGYPGGYHGVESVRGDDRE